MNSKEQIALKNEMALIDALFDGINIANKLEARLDIRQIILEWRIKRNEIIETFGLADSDDDNGVSHWQPPAHLEAILKAETVEDIMAASGAKMECKI